MITQSFTFINGQNVKPEIPSEAQTGSYGPQIVFVSIKSNILQHFITFLEKRLFVGIPAK